MPRIDFRCFKLMLSFPSLKTMGCLSLVALGLVACSPDRTQALLEPSQALGVVLAEETVRAAGANHQVVVISPNANWGPMSTVETAFRSALKKQGFSIASTKSVDLGNPMRFQAGLKGADFLAALDQAGGAGAVVSLCGAPVLSPGDLGLVAAAHPPVLVVATTMLGAVPGVAGNRSVLTSLLAAKIIQLAIIDGSDSAAPNAGKRDPAHELFYQNYRILRPGDQ
jgi:hypothetical protein